MKNTIIRMAYSVVIGALAGAYLVMVLLIESGATK